jgi:hypothetical protein
MGAAVRLGMVTCFAMEALPFCFQSAGGAGLFLSIARATPVQAF